MIGIIISGHGHFATGLYSAVQLIAGEQPHFQAIDFQEGMDSDTINKLLNKAIDEVNQGDGVVIFTDLIGGTPFNQSVVLSTQKPNVKVVAGTNLPGLLEGLYAREESLEDFVAKILDAGQFGYKQFEK